MNIVKKLKSALLATSVMLFPKAGHTMDVPDNTSNPKISKKLETSEKNETFTTSKSSESASEKDPMFEVEEKWGRLKTKVLFDRRDMWDLFSVNFQPTDEITSQIRSLLTEDPQKFIKKKTAISNGIKEFLPRYLMNFSPFGRIGYNLQPVFNDMDRDTSPEEASAKEIRRAVQAIVPFALTLSPEEIEKRMQNSVKLLDQLESELFFKGSLRTLDDSSSFSLQKPLIQLFSNNTASYCSLFNDLVKLDPNEAQNRINTIVKNKLAFKLSTNDLTLKLIFPLIKLDSDEIGERAKLMNKMYEYIVVLNYLDLDKMSFFQGTSVSYFLELINKLKNDELESRIPSLDLVLEAQSELGEIIPSLIYIAFQHTPEDFQSYVQLIRENKELLIPALKQDLIQKLERDRFSLLAAPVKEIKDRVSAVTQYKDLLDWAAKNQKKHLGVAGYLENTPDEIYEIANKVNFEKYNEDFLPRFVEEFRKINESSVTDDAILTLIDFIFKQNQSLVDQATDFETSVSARKKIFGILGTPYQELYNPTPLPKPQPSEETESSPSSSSGPLSSMARPELEALSQPSSSSSIHSAPTTFRTAGANENAEIKHSAIYASFPYQIKPDAAYSLIINHRTKDKGSEVRVFNPNTKTYIDLGRLSSSTGFSDQVFNLSSLFEGSPSSSSGASIMRTELNFIDGISDIHSFTITSGKERLMEVILGDEGSEKQTGVHVYAPELSGKRQEWSQANSEDVEE